MPSRRPAVLFAVLLTAITFPAAGQDYSKELPRIPPKEPAKALKTFQLRPGFRIELVASEPMIRSPVALDFDEDGRLFVVEYPEYNQDPNKVKNLGRVRMLEDTDGDGRFDKATTVVDKLNAPTAVACYDGGLYVGAVPDILYCKGGGCRPVYTGFDRDQAGEGMLNSLRWGLDNRFHLSTSLAGGNVRPADRKDAKPVSVRNRGFLFDPRTGKFEVTSGGGQHGMCLDDWGRKFVCSNSEPLNLVMYDGRYLDRNPYLAAPRADVNIAPEGASTKLKRISPTEPWRVLRTRLRWQGVVPGPKEGGQPTGFFTSATGVTVYRGDAWPAKYRGTILVGEVASNLVYRADLRPRGVGLVAERADADGEFLASSDIWFRPVQFANGPDGCLYVLDFYRELVETVVSIPPEITKHLDPTSGMDRGRIYRIVPEGFKQPRIPKLSQATTAELVALLEHPNGWHRETASRLLYQRQDRAAVAPLKKLAAESKSPLGRMQALYALSGLQALEVAQVKAALNDPEPRVREHALRLAEAFADDPIVQNRFDRMTDYADLRVRYQLAFSLGQLPGERPNRSLARLAVYDGADPWFRLAILSSLNGRAGEVFSLLADEHQFRKTAAGRSFLEAVATLIGAANRPAEVAAVIRVVESLPGDEATLARGLVRGLMSRGNPLDKVGGKTGAVVSGMLKEARRVAADENFVWEQRVAAIRTLRTVPFAEVRPLFRELLKLRQPPQVQTAALQTLAHFNRPEVAELLLEAWPGLSPTVRATAAETLFARPAWVNAFLGAVERGKVGTADVDPNRVKLLLQHPDPSIRKRAEQLFARSKFARRQDVVATYQKALGLKGDAARGKAVFKKVCSACHRLEGVGNSVGADITAIRDRGNPTILLNILDPNREVQPRFLSYLLVTDAGRSITGMIVDESPTSVTIRRADGTSETVLRVHIEELRSTGMSFMPEGLETQVDHQGMADLLAYLNSIR
jgi:putative membrane-bound dehydrogenase-like protein